MGFVCSCELHVKVDTLKFSDFVDSVFQNTEQSLDILFLFQSHVLYVSVFLFLFFTCVNLYQCSSFLSILTGLQNPWINDFDTTQNI